MNRTARIRTVFCYLSVVILAITSGNWLQPIVTIFANVGPNASASISAQSEQGNNGWYIDAVSVTISTQQTSAPVKSITFWLDSDPQQTVQVSSTTQTFAQNGSHVLSFYATDVNNLNGPTNTLAFKVDTISPKNWTNITQVRDGNSHTFRFSASVSDPTAGLDPQKVYMQYNSDDTGTNWGYYSNLGQCNSEWNDNQWKQVPQSFAAGATTATITTPAVDYCNNSGSGCDFMKVRVYDTAGNFADKKICLGSPWLQTQYGNVRSVANISMLAEGPQPNATEIVSSRGTIDSFSSANNWYMAGYNSNMSLDGFEYNSLNSKVGTSALSLPSGRLPTTNGFYKVNSNWSISSSTLPAGYSTAQNFATVILINGTVTINTNIATHPSSALIIVASGGIDISQSVTSLAGIYISNGVLDTSYNGNGNNQLTVNGALYSNGGFDLDRNLGTNTNKTTPAEKIIFRPSILLNTALQSLLAGTVRYDWREVAP